MTTPKAMSRNLSPRVGERGFALLVVLWTMTLLALLVTHLTAVGRGETHLASNLLSEATLEAAADGAFAEAIFHMLDAPDRRWPTNGVAHRIRFSTVITDVRIDSQAGKVNPNMASSELLEALLCSVGADERTAAAIAAGIVEWRSPETPSRPGEVKKERYRDAMRDYAPPSSDFQTLDELGLVLGMTPTILTRLRPSLSLYQKRDPDPRSADTVVLQAMRVMTKRTTPPFSSATTHAIDPILSLRGPGDAPNEDLVAVVVTAMGPNSGRYNRRAVVRVGEHGGSGLFRILAWDEGR